YIKEKELFIPIDWIIGEQKMAGDGWRMLVECLSIGRAISLTACGTANTLMSAVITSAYASEREQFKVPIAQYEVVQEKLAKTAVLA
ncbi:acyl-CoA dehydrogenase family protein, partial [Francisella tularensis]|uniref:acyl-CoA dehydrogenase family protein n=1 Tax=Francisella tularensis TaxID=263 RepID=UPI002381B54B